MGQKTGKIICYADDAILMAQNEDELQRLLYGFTGASQELNMEISVEKTKSMVISREPIRCKLVVYDKIIEQVMSFKYLGIETTSTRSLFNEVRSQANNASRISGYLRDTIWNNKYMSTNSKVRIYKTCIRPILTYAAETRAETAKTKRLARTTEMRTLRNIRGVTLRDRIRSRDIREECGVQDVVRFVRARRRHWRDHINRMGPERLVKWASEEIPASRRPPGRPPKRWHECWSSTSQKNKESRRNRTQS